MTSPQTNGSGNGGNSGGGKPSAARWPDLLIGLLVLLLLGGFGVLLFGQRSGNTANTAAPTTTPAPATPAESAEIPAAPGTATITPANPDPAPTDAQAGIPPATAQPAEQATQQPAEQPTEPAQTPAPTPAVPEAATPETAAPPTATAPTATPPVTPPTPGASATTPTTSLNDIPTIVAAPIETVPAEAAPAAQPAAPAATTDPATTNPVAPVSPAARTGGAVATSETRTPLRSDYRISLGTFSSEAAANSRTAGVSGLGYRVYPINLGSEVVAQIGPFSDEATARQALADVVRAYPGAILYPPRNRNLTGGTVSGTAPANPTTESTTPAAAAPVTPTPATPTPQAAAPSGPVYLQVGAFDRVEGAQNLVGTLREQGFAPTVNAPEGRKVTVLVGPFSGDALTRAEERLTSSGLDSFRVR